MNSVLKNYEQNMKSAKAGFTLIELLVAISIFAIVSVVVSTVYVTAFRVSNRTTLESQVISDTQFLLNRIAEEIQNNAIDYEEYYSRKVLNASTYGQNYGAYHTLFYHPGRKYIPDTATYEAGVFPEDIGMLCNTGEEWSISGANSECTILRLTEDKETGQNPYANRPGVTAGSANAFCDETRGVPCAGVTNTQPELYLISPDAKTKTIFALEKIGGGTTSAINALSFIRMSGSDTNNDGKIDAFACHSDFDCEGGNSPSASDLTTTADLEQQHLKHFIPLSALRLNVTSLSFYISPLEDSRRAYDETTEAIQQPQKVTIIIEVVPNPELTSGAISKDFQPLTMQRTVVSQVREKIESPIAKQYL